MDAHVLESSIVAVNLILGEAGGGQRKKEFNLGDPLVRRTRRQDNDKAHELRWCPSLATGCHLLPFRVRR